MALLPSSLVNARLTTRDVIGKNPKRILISNNNLLSKKYSVFNADAETIVIDTRHLKHELPLAKQICKELFDRQIISLIVEGGPKTLQHFIDENLWDEARVFEGTAEIDNGIKAPNFSINSRESLNVGEDRLWMVMNKLS